MSLRYLLIAHKRNEVREAAREGYLLYPLDEDAAIKHATDQLVTKSILTSILIGIAIKLITELIKYWINNLVLIPSGTYEKGEPGYE